MDQLKSYRISDSIQNKYPDCQERIEQLHELFDKCRNLSLLNELDGVVLPTPVMTYFVLINVRQYYLFRSLIVEINDENAYGAFKALRGLIETVAVLVSKYKDGKDKFERDPESIWQFFADSLLEARNFPSQKFIEQIREQGESIEPVVSKNISTYVEKAGKWLKNCLQEEATEEEFSSHLGMLYSDASNFDHPTFLNLHIIEAGWNPDGSPRFNHTQALNDDHLRILLSYSIITQNYFEIIGNRFIDFLKEVAKVIKP